MSCRGDASDWAKRRDWTERGNVLWKIFEDEFVMYEGRLKRIEHVVFN